MDFAIPVDHKTERKMKREINTWILQENWKNMEHERGVDTICN